MTAKKTFTISSLAFLCMGVLSFLLGRAAGYAFDALSSAGFAAAGSSYASFAAQIVIMYGIAMPSAMLILRLVPASRIEKTSLPAGQILKYLLICFPVTVIGSIAGNILSSLLSLGRAQDPLDRYIQTPGVMSFILTVLLAPFFEELLFRKLLIDRTVKYGEKNAVLFSAVVFALMHGNFFQIFYTFGAGLVFAYIYVRTGKLRYTLLIHVIMNFLGSVVSPAISAWVKGAAGQPYYPAAVTVSVLFAVSYFAATVAGIVFFVKKVRRLQFKRTEEELLAEERTETIYYNAGFVILAAAQMIRCIINLLP